MSSSISRTPASRDSTTCSICLKRLRCSKIGKPDACNHIFCYTCILEWAKSVNTCPVDRIRFNTLEVFDSVDGKCVEKVPVIDKDIQNEPQEFTQCETCHDHRREHELLLCDGCDKGYHLSCLTPPLPEVPEEDWYCPVCLPIVLAQYQLSSTDNMAGGSFEWASSSGSNIETRCNRNSRSRPLVITDSIESESDSDIDEFRKRRTVLNICSGGVVLSDSTDEFDGESPLQQLPLDDVSETMYIDLLRRFSKRSQSARPSENVPRVPEEPRKSSVRIKSCSVPIVSIQPKVLGHISSQSTLLASTSQSSSQPSTSQLNTHSQMKKRLPCKRKKRPRLLLANKKRCEPKTKSSQSKSRRKSRQRSKMYYRAGSFVTQPDARVTRSRARTVATYTPQQNVFRAAARESYKHSDLNTGLRNARKIILESGTSFRHPRTPIKNCSTPQSGYLNQSYHKIPLRAASEIKRRSVPEKRRLLIDSSTYANPPSSSSVFTAGNTSGSLLDDIYQGLDVLNNSNSTIQRDGTIVGPKSDDRVPAITRAKKPAYDSDRSSNASRSYDSDCSSNGLPASLSYDSDRSSNGLPASRSCDSDRSNGLPASRSYDSDRSSNGLPASRSCDSNRSNGLPASRSCDSNRSNGLPASRSCDSNGLPASRSCDSNRSNGLPASRSYNSNRSSKAYPFLVLDSISDSDSTGQISDYLSSQRRRSANTHITPPLPPDKLSDPQQLGPQQFYPTAPVDVSSLASVQQIVKNELNHHYAVRNITDHQYHRILQRATEKIMKGRRTNMDRVKKLVLDFVVQYKSIG